MENVHGRCLAGRMAMHACQIGPTDTAPPCPGSPLRACIGTKEGTLWGRQPFCPHFSSATQVCGQCDYKCARCDQLCGDTHICFSKLLFAPDKLCFWTYNTLANMCLISTNGVQLLRITPNSHCGLGGL